MKFLRTAAVSCTLLLPLSAFSSPTFAVWLSGQTDAGGNSIPTFLNQTFGAGSATLVTDAQLATPGFLNGFSTLVMSRQGSSFGNSTLSLAEITNIQNYVGLAGSANQGGVAVFTSDAADTFPTSQSGDPIDINTGRLFSNAATFAAASGHGFLGEYNGAALAFSSNANGSSLGLLQGAAGFLGFESIGNFVYVPGPVGGSNPIDNGVNFPFTDNETSTYGFTVTGYNPNNVVDIYSAPGSIYDKTPAVLANSFVISGGNPTPSVPDATSTFGLVAGRHAWVGKSIPFLQAGFCRLTPRFVRAS